MPRRIKKEKKEKRRLGTRKRACKFCTDKELIIDYKLAKLLSYYVTESGKIIPRRITGNCAFHQRRVVEAVNRARVLAILPYCLAETSL